MSLLTLRQLGYLQHQSRRHPSRHHQRRATHQANYDTQPHRHAPHTRRPSLNTRTRPRHHRIRTNHAQPLTVFQDRARARGGRKHGGSETGGEDVLDGDKVSCSVGGGIGVRRGITNGTGVVCGDADDLLSGGGFDLGSEGRCGG